MADKKPFSKYRPKSQSSTMWPHGHCSFCGEMMDDYTSQYCSTVCQQQAEAILKRQRRITLYINIAFIAYAIIISIMIFLTTF